MGPTREHPHTDQRSDWSLAEHHLGLDFVDSRFCHRIHTRWPTIRYIWQTVVLHHVVNIGTCWEYRRCKRTEHQHAHRYECMHIHIKRTTSINLIYSPLMAWQLPVSFLSTSF
jgi:hypothetical protein